MRSSTPKLTCCADGVAPRSWARCSQRGVLPFSGCRPGAAASAGPATAAIDTTMAPASNPAATLYRGNRNDPIRRPQTLRRTAKAELASTAIKGAGNGVPARDLSVPTPAVSVAGRAYPHTVDEYAGRIAGDPPGRAALPDTDYRAGRPTPECAGLLAGVRRLLARPAAALPGP